MQASDAVVITLPGTPDTAISGLGSQLRRLKGVEGAFPRRTRGRPEGDGAAIVLKINRDTLSTTPELVTVLHGIIELLRAQSIATAVVRLPNGTIVAGTTEMSEEEINGKLQEAERRFDVAVSFADENRQYVSQVVKALGLRGVSVFYDADLGVELWGQDLVTYLDGVYRHRSRYVVIFVSERYVNKDWTRHELRSALAHAMTERGEYVLPARFDDSDLPGLPPTVRYVDCRLVTPVGLAEMIVTKLGR